MLGRALRVTISSRYHLELLETAHREAYDGPGQLR